MATFHAGVAAVEGQEIPDHHNIFPEDEIRLLVSRYSSDSTAGFAHMVSIQKGHADSAFNLFWRPACEHPRAGEENAHATLESCIFPRCGKRSGSFLVWAVLRNSCRVDRPRVVMSHPYLRTIASILFGMLPQ